MQAQSQANAKAAEQAAMAEVQKKQALAQTELQIEQGKSQFDLQKIQTEGEIKKQLMTMQFEFDKQLKAMELQQMQQKEKAIEDRKDQRSKMEATQQSEMIRQRQDDLLPINFSSPPKTQPEETPMPQQAMGQEQMNITEEVNIQE